MTSLKEKTIEDLKRLDVVVYRGLHLRSLTEQGKKIVDDWLIHKEMSLSEWEDLLNHIHVMDHFQFLADEAEQGVKFLADEAEQEVMLIADEVFRSWVLQLSALDHRYRVIQSYDFGPQITFFLDRDMEPTK